MESTLAQDLDAPAAFDVTAGELRYWGFLFPLGLPHDGNQLPRVARAIIRGAILEVQVFVIRTRNESSVGGMGMALRWLERSILLDATSRAEAPATITRVPDWKEALALVAMEPQRKGKMVIQELGELIPFPEELRRFVSDLSAGVPELTQLPNPYAL